MTLRRFVVFLGEVLLLVLILGGSVVPIGDKIEQVRAFTRQIEFNYLDWLTQAASVKLAQSASRTVLYLTPQEQSQLVLGYLELIKQYEQADSQLTEIYADPKIDNPEDASRATRQTLEILNQQISKIAPLAEAIFESQLSNVIAEAGLSLGGQPLPPISFHISPIPSSLIVSPRNVIKQEANISLKTDITTAQKIRLENEVEKALNVSSLVVPIGGIGIYPTMVMQTTDINWLAEVVAHEWTHNFLDFRPLGVNYDTTPELRTMNETTASIVGKELGRMLISQYYPQYLPPPTVENQPEVTTPEATAPEFNFNHEMHLTRIRVDQLLAQGKIIEAESYMEQQRVMFWEHGYHIRKLNQAYFAFYGAYADEPQGAAGEDPIGKAVRLLRSQSATLADFVNRISWMWSTQQLMEAVHG
ncbi:MAG: hypothetical protein ACPL3P_07810 [Anaerolineales bacterium]